MKYEWEASDIKAGILAISQGVWFQVGYLMGLDTPNYILTDLRDGGVVLGSVNGTDKESIATHLNSLSAAPLPPSDFQKPPKRTLAC